MKESTQSYKFVGIRGIKSDEIREIGDPSGIS
jgi:hypothetical protein